MTENIDLHDLVGRFIRLIGNWQIRDMSFQNEVSKKDLIVYVKCFIKEEPVDFSNENEQSYVIIDSDCKEMVTHIRYCDKIEILS